MRMPRTLLLLFRGRSNGYQIFAAPLANNASLDKPESLFTIAGYSFVVFFLGGSNVDSSCCRFNLQFSEATFVALRFPFFLSDEFARACELLFSVAGTCYDYVQTSFLTAIACYRKIKLPEQGVIGLCLWSAIYFVYDQHFIVSQTSYAKQHSLRSFQTFYSLSETNQEINLSSAMTFIRPVPEIRVLTATWNSWRTVNLVHRREKGGKAVGRHSGRS